MKISLVLFTSAAMYFFTACNNGSEKSTTNTDTTASATNATTEQPSTPKDTAKSGSDLMKPMDDMMAKM